MPVPMAFEPAAAKPATQSVRGAGACGTCTSPVAQQVSEDPFESDARSLSESTAALRWACRGTPAFGHSTRFSGEWGA